MNNPKVDAFTLAELLISLALLGVIATFTIPKVLNATTSAKSKAIAKEAASIISGAYQAYRIENNVTASTKFGDMASTINYVSAQTSGQIDSKETDTFSTCAVSTPCLRLHNGATLRYNSNSFSGTANTNALEFMVDPDSVYSGLTTGPSKSVNFFLYFNGRLVTRGTTEPNTIASGNTYASPSPSLDPSWFGWD